ncbi:MAG TPA: helix-turn-helix domain-containing protein [Planctomicrobium sp.]|nr:helix-turn-helix domain-containing protein [Planctomicrobium sp.]
MAAIAIFPVKLNRRDAAEYVGVKYETLCVWATSGRGPKYYKAGNKVWYLQKELDRWIEERSTNCASTLKQ